MLDLDYDDDVQTVILLRKRPVEPPALPFPLVRRKRSAAPAQRRA